MPGDQEGGEPPAIPPEPDQRLERSVLVPWCLSGLVGGAIAVVVTMVLAPVLDEVDGMPGWVHPAVVVLGACAAVAALVTPLLRYRAWRYAVREEEIDIRHGTWVVTRTIVPMARIQHVDTMRTFTGQLLELATLRIHTAAGTHAIPGLDSGSADLLRTRIAVRARVPDDV